MHAAGHFLGRAARALLASHGGVLAIGHVVVLSPLALYLAGSGDDLRAHHFSDATNHKKR